MLWRWYTCHSWCFPLQASPEDSVSVSILPEAPLYGAGVGAGDGADGDVIQIQILNNRFLMIDWKI